MAFGVLLVLLGTLIDAGAVSAQEEAVVEFRITGFGPEQTCLSGTNQVSIETARPFVVEACVLAGEEPVPDATLTAVVTHPDGTAAEIVQVTGSDGSTQFPIEPLDAGTTTVTVCYLENCDWGSVEMQAASPPPPPAVASYLGPTDDIGQAAALTDEADDFFDPYTGGPAESNLGDPAIDIVQFDYLGVQSGAAVFRFTMLGDPCETLSDNPPFAQLSVRVDNTVSGNYFVGSRWQMGEWVGNARSDDARLDGVTITIDPCVGDNVVELRAEGVDVAAGSTVAAQAWLSLDPMSSGYQDDVEGLLVAASGGGSVADDGSVAVTDTGSPSTTTDDEGGSFPFWLPIVFFGVVVGGVSFYRTRLGGSTAVADVDPSEVTMADLEQYRDSDLGGGPATLTRSREEISNDAWLSILHREEQIQEAYLGDFERVLREIVDAYQRYRSAIDLFREKFVKIASASTDMQGYLQRWQDVQKTAEKQDLAFGIITLVWGVGSLGGKVFRWLTKPKAGAKAAGAAAGAADDVATGGQILADGGTVVDDALPNRVLDQLTIDKWMAEVGVSWDEWIAAHKFDYAKAELALRRYVGLSRGWHGITDHAADVINRLLVNGRSAVAGRGATIDPADIAELRSWAERAGFWDGLLTTAGDLGDEIALFYTADDVKFLKALLESGDDLASLKTLLGPAQETALVVAADVINDVPSLAGISFQGGRVTFNALDSASDIATFGETSQVAGGLDLGSYTDQFGGWAGSFNDGVGWFMLHGAWGMLTSPYEWFYGIVMTAEAMDRYTEFLEGSRDDLIEMGGALGDAVAALNDLAGAIDRADLDDPTSSLGGRRAGELRDLVGEMDALLDDASAEWADEHRADIEARKAHITQKIADLERITLGFDAQLGRLRQLAGALDAARRNEDGSLRDVVDLWNPGLLTALGAGDLVLRGVIGGALSGGSHPNPPSASDDSRPPPADIFSPDYDPFADFDAAADDAYEAEWRQELGDVFTDWEPGAGQ